MKVKGLTEDKNIFFLQSFGIILVVLGHTGAEDKGVILAILQKWIYSFHMPLFMFISGYLLSYTNLGGIEKIKVANLIKNKFKRLLLPYFVISSIAYIPKYILNKFAERPIEFSLENFIHGFLYPWDNPIIFFWFLPTLFIIMIVTVISFKNISVKNKTEIFLGVSLLLTLGNKVKVDFLNITGVINYLFFFILGIFYLKNKNIIEKILFKNKTIYLFLFFSILCANSVLSFKGKVAYVAIAVIGILFSVILSQLYVENDLSFLDHLRYKNFTIYLLSWFPQVFVRILGFQILNLNWVIVFPISVILGIYAPVTVGEVVKKFGERNSKIKKLYKIIGI